jgi:hypothetical protein
MGMSFGVQTAGLEWTPSSLGFERVRGAMHELLARMSGV